MGELASALAIAEDAGYGQNCCFRRRSLSCRSFRTKAAEPALSSGWSLSFHAPAAWLMAARTQSCLLRRLATTRSMPAAGWLGGITRVLRMLMEEVQARPTGSLTGCGISSGPAAPASLALDIEREPGLNSVDVHAPC